MSEVIVDTSPTVIDGPESVLERKLILEYLQRKAHNRSSSAHWLQNICSARDICCLT
jgi:hypothetical protein